ncbi:streptavidin-V2-like [Mercenaria mercenaria]|uniref:streptavidin-V2-like n=1 Tax=Mercenaria mercenaria TaxID=6596 RepID=UPI00234F568A|nr:streptavidin-V2-like [Mercenaria mercenaria]XP_053400816.1 streptavidin-V2-like [Mercenaria mercenaria]
MTVVYIFLTISTIVAANNHQKRFIDPVKNGYEARCAEIQALNENHCGIAGLWTNQLKSVMEFTCKDGHLNGRYNTAVGQADDYYSLTGKYTMSGPNGADCVMGWVVSFNNKVFGNSNSTAAWSGIHYAHEHVIRTHWVLTRWHPLEDIRKTTTINHDDFVSLC